MADPTEPRSPLESTLSRRTVLKGAVGVAGLASVPALIAACSGGAASPTAAPPASQPAGSAPAASAPASAGAGGQVTVGDYHTDTQGEKDGIIAVHKAFTDATGITVKDNIVDHSTFQDQITSYLAARRTTCSPGSPGYRMRFFADQGLATAHRRRLGQGRRNYTEGFKAASTGDDGKQYFVPIDYYPWARPLSQERVRGEGLHRPDDLGRAEDPGREDARPTASSRSPSPTTTAGRRWAPSTSSTSA